jgi:hypothetical protein
VVQRLDRTASSDRTMGGVRADAHAPRLSRWPNPRLRISASMPASRPRKAR